VRLSSSLLLLLALVACQPGAAPTPAVPAAGSTAASPAPAAEPRSLAVGYASLTPRLGVLFLAEELGLFRQQGLEVRSSYVKSASVAQAALAAGEIQVALAGLSAAMAARAAGADLVIVGGLLDRSISELVVQPSIREPADLRGKRIGVNSLSGTVYTRTITVLDRLGLEPSRDNITIQAVGDEPTLAQALRAGAIDGATFNYPLSRPMRAEGFPTWDLAELDVLDPSNAFAFAGSLARGDPAAVDGFLRAMIQSIAYVKSTPAYPERRAVLLRAVTERLDLSAEQAAYELDVLPAVLPGNAMFRRAVVEEVYQFMLHETPALARLPLEEVVDFRYVQRLEAEGFVPQP
jgi:ABC-type nitrate/sulfonate/bicarbonate transport system substrate-binding protein